MKLVIAEKPSVAMSIAKVIGANNKKDGYIDGNGYVVSWCIGHLVGLANPDAYDEKYSKWKYEDLPIMPQDWKYSLNTSTKKQYKVLEKLIKSDEITEIVEATDAGREGELIFRLVYNMIGVNKPFKRLWISSMEDTAIEEGFENLKNGSDYDKLYESALARSKADWLVGLNATRLFTTIYNNKLSVGRVQTPTLAMITERDYEINNFVQNKFYNLELDLGNFKVASERIDKLEEVKKLEEFCNGKKVLISQVKKEMKKNKPSLLFDLTTLQRQANKWFGYTAKQTLDYTQSLYEKKLVTYPRTDSRCITEDMKNSVICLVKEIDANIEPDLKRICNNKKVTDHHAIIPTKQSLNTDLTNIPKNERNIYELIKNKLLTSVGSEYIYEQTTVIANVEDKMFVVKGKIVIDKGYKEKEDKFKKNIGMQVKEVDVCLPDIKEKDEFNIKTSNIKEGLTTPPKHYTEDTLLSAMEKAGTEELDKTLDTEKKGLGTPATRAGIIEKLINTGYIERKKKNLLVTEKGRELIKIIPANIKSAKLTSEWENKLTEISNGDRNVNNFINEIQNEVADLVENFKDFQGTNNFKSDREIIGKCPRCGANIYEGKKNFYCSNRECNFSMWKEDRFFKQKKKTLTKTITKKLLENGKVKVKKLYSEKKDKEYDAIVVLDDTGKYVNYKLEF